VRLRRGRQLAGAALLAAVAAATLVAAPWRDAGASSGGGRRRTRPRAGSVALPPSGRFALRYRHSVYRAEVTETFAAAADGGFRLVAVASPSEAVLDYYELEGRRGRDGGWRRLEPDAAPRLAALPLVATEVGRRTLVVEGRRLPCSSRAAPRPGWCSASAGEGGDQAADERVGGGAVLGAVVGIELGDGEAGQALVAGEDGQAGHRLVEGQAHVVQGVGGGRAASAPRAGRRRR
jgi:Domain of unknown function (DUF1850)